MASKRHDKPTQEQLLNRIYRRQIAMSAQLDILQVGQRMLSERVESLRLSNDTVKTLADHCARLLREKESLMKLYHANDFMAARGSLDAH